MFANDTAEPVLLEVIGLDIVGICEEATAAGVVKALFVIE